MTDDPNDDEIKAIRRCRMSGFTFQWECARFSLTTSQLRRQGDVTSASEAAGRQAGAKERHTRFRESTERNLFSWLSCRPNYIFLCDLCRPQNMFIRISMARSGGERKKIE